MPQSGAGATKRYRRKRELIVASAARVFNERGVKGATLADVAAQVGLSLKSLRYYFRRKDDLVATCFLYAIDVYRDLIDEASSAATPSERLKILLVAFFRTVAAVRTGEHPAFLHFSDIRTLEAEHRDTVHAAYSDMFRGIRGLLTTAGPTETRRASNAAAHLVLSQLLWAVVWTGRYESDQLPRVAQRMHDVLVQGLAAVEHDALSARLTVPVLVRPSSSGRSNEAFLRAATGLINAHGYSGASVEKISAELQVTKGSFYHHNARKADLVVDCFERTFEIMRTAQSLANERFQTGYERLLAAVLALVRFQLTDDGPLLRTAALTTLPPELRSRMTMRMDNVTDRFGEMLTDGMIDGTVRPADAAIAAQMITSMINAAAVLYRWVPDVTEDDALTLYARRLFVGLFGGGGGIAPPPPSPAAERLST